MHRALFGETDDNQKIVEYFAKPKIRGLMPEIVQGCLLPDDFYIYFTAHSYKHFNNSGCGLRTLMDYYILLKRSEENNTLDFKYINKELKKIDLLDFSNRISSLAIKVFEEQELNQEELDMLLYIASSGTYGTLENNVSKGVRKKGKFRYFMSRVFPPMSFYKSNYSWAYKTKVLIPVAWLCRFFRILFKNPKRATAELKMISKSKEEKSGK